MISVGKIVLQSVPAWNETRTGVFSKRLVKRQPSGSVSKQGVERRRMRGCFTAKDSQFGELKNHRFQYCRHLFRRNSAELNVK
jgi:hypothetical protein